VYFGDIAQTLFDAAVGTDEAQDRYMAWVDAEQDNLRAASGYAQASADGETELRLAANLWYASWVRGSLTEGRARLEKALDRGGDANPALLARGLAGAAGLATAQGDYERARQLGTEALPLAAASKAAADEGSARTALGVAALAQRDFDAARDHFEQALALAESVGLTPNILANKLNLGLVALESGETEKAIAMLEDIRYENRGFACLNLGVARYRLGEYEAAQEAWEEAREAFAEWGFRAHIGHALQGLAAVETKIGDATEAARLLGRAAGLLHDIGASADDFDPTLAGEAEAASRAVLGDETFQAAYEEGMRTVGTTKVE
jgi:tetratricopeptide (TPR) repeat protein